MGDLGEVLSTETTNLTSDVRDGLKGYSLKSGVAASREYRGLELLDEKVFQGGTSIRYWM